MSYQTQDVGMITPELGAELEQLATDMVKAYIEKMGPSIKAVVQNEETEMPHNIMLHAFNNVVNGLINNGLSVNNDIYVAVVTEVQQGFLNASRVQGQMQ